MKMIGFFIKSSVNKITLSLIVVLLAGCRNEEVNNNPLIATDAFYQITGDSNVDLSDRVIGSDRETVLTAVRSKDAGCGVNSIDDLMFNPAIEGAGLCLYSYSVSNATTTSTANALIISTSSVSPLLPMISHSMKTEQQVQLNLNNLLGSAFPSGFALNTTNIQTLGDMADEATVSATGNIITYTAPSVAGWNRLVYTLENSTDSTQKKLGV
ncbi:hypothetical protein VP758_005271, partial [Vibrio harveyi]|nr:hypothetical protein [Vibrio harveyi]